MPHLRRDPGFPSDVLGQTSVVRRIGTARFVCRVNHGRSIDLSHSLIYRAHISRRKEAYLLGTKWGIQLRPCTCTSLHVHIASCECLSRHRTSVEARTSHFAVVVDKCHSRLGHRLDEIFRSSCDPDCMMHPQLALWSGC